jgi:nicotinamidase-related amidase
MTDTPALTPASTALLVMDYQNGVVPMIDNAEALIARVAEVIERFRSSGGQIAYVRVGFTPEDIAAMPPTSGMRAAAAGRSEALAGISTSGVVLSTVPDAYDRDYRLIVLSDLVADRDPELHRCLIEQVFPKRAEVITSAEFEARL